MKKIEPAKKTTPSAPGPTNWTNPGNGPMKKHRDPTANPAAIQRSQAALSIARCATASEWPIKGAPAAQADGR